MKTKILTFAFFAFKEASSDDDDEEGQKSPRKSKKTVETIKVTIKMIDGWKTALKTDPAPRFFREVTQAFKAAIATTMGEGGGQCRYKVADSSGQSNSNMISLIMHKVICIC